ncbi:MAG: hypothetical protein B6A08_14070 [Sorangiineae bacterium NIC37A_2]|nr:MAG: hypothetical protein B6A08_14070 [Sorangiineae bacterium NIC37A_2]
MLHPDLQSAVQKRCEFVLLFDSDCWLNNNVALAIATLAAQLRQSDAASVRLALLPHARDGSKRGPDDALVQDGFEALQALIDDAVPSDPIEWLDTVPESLKAVALLRSLPFLASLHLLDEPEFDLLVASFRKHKIRVQNVRDARADFRKKLAAKARQGTPVQDPPRYGFDKVGRNCVICTEGDTGSTTYEPLSNVGAKVVREEIHDDGAVQSRIFVLEGQLEDGTALPLAEVPAADFSRMDWVYSSWGARAAIVAGSMPREQFRESIQLLSRPEVTTVYGHTGWREIDGEPSFLFHGGAIGDQSLSVRLSGFMERFVLPCHASKEPLGGVELVFQLLEVAPHEVTIPLVSAAFLAPLASIVSPDFALWLVGPTGSLKSEMASLAASFFGSFTRLTMGSWSSTENALEAQMFEAKDVVFVIDDYAPQPSPRARAILQEKAARTIRGMGNGSSRSRLRADLTQRPNRPPRCLLICTGEEMPVGASILARLVRIDLDRASIDLAKLTAVQNQRQRLPGVMADYIHHLRHDHPRLKDELPERKVARRARFVTLGGHMRQPEALAMLSLGFESFLEYAQTTLAIGPTERDAWMETADKALWHLGEGNAIRMRQGDPVAVFLDSLRELLASGAVCLKPHGMDLDLFPEQHPIGWQDDLHVYLLMQLAHEEVSKLCRSGGTYFGTSVDALRQLLFDAGMLVRPRRGDRLEVSVRAGSKTIRVTKLISTNLNLPASDADETAPEHSPGGEAELEDLLN